MPQDYAEALVWYRRAAESGYAKAQFAVGTMYIGGEGVPQDYVLAHMWLNLAGAGGRERAGELRDLLARHMTPAQIADAQRLAQEWMQAHRAE